MRAMGLDLGSKTLGLALSDPSGLIASGYKTISFNENDYKYALNELLREIKETRAEILVLGLPKNMDGSIGFQAQKSLDFKAMIQKNLSIEVVMWDERLTSKMANSLMISADYSRKKRKTKVDKLAATLILQSYLDSRKREY